MNKKFKIVSSIALTGLLLTGGFSAKTFATTTTTESGLVSPVGIYKQLIEGKTAVPFLLASKTDSVTVKDIANYEKFKGVLSTVNGTKITSEDTLLKTGDRFTTTDGTEYTVVIYGDVDKNGKINVLDALEIEESLVSETSTLDAVQTEAADVGSNDGKINVMDSLAIKEYLVDLRDTVIDKLPAAEAEEEVESNYTVTINENNVVNSTNKDSSTIAVKVAETLDEAGEITVKLTDSEGNEYEQTVTIPAHTDYVEVSDVALDSMEDGTITVEIIDDEDVVVSTFTVTKNTTLPEATNVTAKRTSTREATLSLEKCGESDITKVYYVVRGLDDTVTSVDDLTNSVDVTDSKLVDTLVANSLETKTAYKVFYVLENSYGSQSEIKEVVIASDDASVVAEEKLEEVTAPDLSKDETEFTWDAVSGKTYIVTLYKDSSAAEVQEVKAQSTNGSVEFDLSEAGSYKVSVVVKGADDGTSTNSEATESDEVVVTNLAAVQNITIENGETKTTISWTDTNNSDDVLRYTVVLYTIDEDGKEVFSKSYYVDKEENSAEVEIDANKMYVAKITVEPNESQNAILASEEATSSEFYKVNAPKITDADVGSDYITLNVDAITISGKTVTYKVKIYEVNTSNDYTEARYTEKETRTLTIDEDGKAKIDGLTTLKTYAFKIVATVDDTDVESSYSEEITILPEFNNVTVASENEAKEENSGKVAVSGSNIIVNGNSIDTTSGAGAVKLSAIADVVETLEEGDVLTLDVDLNDVYIVLDGAASEEKSSKRTFETVLENSNVTIESNKFNKTITGTFKTLTLVGDGSIFTLTGVAVDSEEGEIVLTDGVEVIGNQTYTVESGATVIINGITVTTTKEVTIVANGTDLELAAGDETNNITFENNSGKDVTITFVGADDYSSEQKGTITINSNGGSVTIESEKTQVTADITITVNSGDVDIQEAALTGTKTVTVTNEKGQESKITAIAQTKAPIAMTNVELRVYTDDELKALPGVDDDNYAEVREYINSFGINSVGAKITVAKDSDEVTITFTEEAQNVQISNLK